LNLYRAVDFAMLFPAVAAFVITVLVLRLLLDSQLEKVTLDFPNHRSLHDTPTPRTGGLAIAAGIGFAWFWLPMSPWLQALGVGALALAVISLIDDVRGLSATLRLTAHFAVCAAFLATLDLDWLWVLVLLVPMVWMVNLYNFMDGLDGLAAGMTVLGFGAYAALAALHGGSALAIVSLCICAAALGFLPFNFAPARVFLGDAGSIPLGFAAAAVGVIGWREGLWRPWIPLVIFSPFIIDATATLGRRALRGRKLTEAHREHYYQRLARSGFGHRNTALLEYALMLIAAIAAVVMDRGESVAPALALAALEVACLVAVSRVSERFRTINGQDPLQ
jgi:UDP-N-acetylmuramyl pentapeptide phosphotransferase/UDP-N-acetylglucosamine-1-phosphate transferase